MAPLSKSVQNEHDAIRFKTFRGREASLRMDPPWDASERALLIGEYLEVGRQIFSIVHHYFVHSLDLI